MDKQTVLELIFLDRNLSAIYFINPYSGDSYLSLGPLDSIGIWIGVRDVALVAFNESASKGEFSGHLGYCIHWQCCLFLVILLGFGTLINNLKTTHNLANVLRQPSELEGMETLDYIQLTGLKSMTKNRLHYLHKVIIAPEEKGLSMISNLDLIGFFGFAGLHSIFIFRADGLGNPYISYAGTFSFHGYDVDLGQLQKAWLI